jgi:hypothetical protein
LLRPKAQGKEGYVPEGIPLERAVVGRKFRGVVGIIARERETEESGGTERSTSEGTSEPDERMEKVVFHPSFRKSWFTRCI